MRDCVNVFNLWSKFYVEDKEAVLALSLFQMDTNTILLSPSSILVWYILPFCLWTVDVKGRERVGGAGPEGGNRCQRELGLEPWFADSFKSFSYVYLLCLYVCMYVQMYSNAICHSLCVEIRGQTTCGNSFSCPTFWSWGWNAGCQAWRQVFYWLNHLASPTCWSFWSLISTLFSFTMGWVAWNDDQWRWKDWYFPRIFWNVSEDEIVPCC